MAGALILCGGTGAHTGVAFMRLHTLGYALGFWDHGARPLDFPTVYLVDQDAADSSQTQATAWQAVRRLVVRHPGRETWFHATGRQQGPELVQATPLPVGPDQTWYQAPYNNLATRFENSPFLSLLTSGPQRRIEYSKGMMGSPAVGSLLFRLKSYDQRGERLNHDQIYGQLLEEEGQIVVVGSGIGGTGASVGPTLAEVMAGRQPGHVMAVMILRWFEFDEEEGDAETIERAARRNRLMRENASSALEFYGRSLAESVAAVPVGMPERSLLKRRFTGDMGQPMCESFVHAVGALCAFRHILRRDKPYAAGLYIMGAVERGRLDGTTAIPGGTLQDLANQGATLARTLDAFARTLGVDHSASRVRPAIYEAVSAVNANPGQIGDMLREEVGHYQEQLRWMEETLDIKPRAHTSFTLEAMSRQRLTNGRKPLPVSAESSPEEIVSALFHWTADWVREEATRENGLRIAPGAVNGGQWPDLRDLEGLGVAPDVNGDLTRIGDGNRTAVLEAFVDRSYLSANGWPHPLAGVDYFRHAVHGQDPRALRQLELMILGVVSDTLRAEPVRDPGEAIAGVNLETLVNEYRRDGGFPTVGEYRLTYPAQNERVIGLSSPHTLLCPVPFMNEEDDNRLWNELWRKLSGARDGAPWHEAGDPASWGEDHDLMIRQVRSWITQLKQVHPSTAPPWTKVFERFQGEWVPFGAGRQLRVCWGINEQGEQAVVDLNLPTPDIPIWIPPAGTRLLDEGEFRQAVPDLTRLEGADGEELFSEVELEVPDREKNVRGWWREHLEALQRLGRIQIWSRDEEGSVILGVMRQGQLMAVRLENSRLLEHSSVAIRSLLPLKQDPIPGSKTPPGQILYPNLPVKGDYLDLVFGPGGKSLLALLKEGKSWNPADMGPRTGRDAQGGQILSWSLRCRGRRDPLPVEVRLAPDTPASSAHWMVWPNLRTRSGKGWRAYYIYTHTENIQVEVDTIWLDGETGRVHVRAGEAGESDYAVFPVSYAKAGGVPHHSGGPPLVLRVRNRKTGEEQGLYPVFLAPVAKDMPQQMDLAIDFGTSHSVAAIKVAGRETQVVGLRPEITATAGSSRPMTHHVSEAASRVMSETQGEGVIRNGEWMPTYYAGPARSFVPSELVFRKPLSADDADDLPNWVPGKDFRIPSLAVGREDLADVLLTDFKWDPDNQIFLGRERDLREHYLSLFLEIVLADVLANEIGAVPTGQINVTFTYPLRTPSHEIDQLKETFHRCLERTQMSTGLTLALHDNVGIYDESRAAWSRRENFGEVGLVADLGGGTLDLFISAHPKGDLEFSQLADSARLGGNLLLRQIAQNPDRYLPQDSKWNYGNNRDTEVKLRAWMRSKGAPTLFGHEAKGSPSLTDFGVRGFARPKQAENGRELIGRYFLLVTEFMARSLTTYLVNHWFPQVASEDYDRLQISVQLRGNGWRLDYETTDYSQITQRVSDLVRERVLALWNEIPGHDYPKPDDGKNWALAADYAVKDPKTAPVRNVAGKSMSYEEVRDSWHTHTLVDLEVHRFNGEIGQIPWSEKIPFDTGGADKVALRELHPPMILSDAADEKKYTVQLRAEQAGTINRQLNEQGYADRGKYRAPVPAVVWETIFREGGLTQSK